MISFLLYAVCCTLLAIYSYGFLDFNLTLSSNHTLLGLLSPLQHLVYFDRPHSLQVYIVIMTLMVCCFIGMFIYYKKTKFPWTFFLVVVATLTLCYPMLSYDVFNYMFHSKILWFYHMNPHLHAPLEFTGDLWLRFMRWVHTPSAYGPVFTAVESPSYILGFGKFVPVLYLMKLTMSGFFVWTIYLIGQITSRLGFTKSNTIFAQLVVAFNPFILMEVVVNGHNDAVMMAIFLFSFLLSLEAKILPSLIALVCSVGTKYVTILTLPMYFIKNIKLKTLFIFITMLAPVVFLPGKFQPWYLVWAIIPAALIDHLLARTWIILASLAGLIYYAPYIATGFWLNQFWFVGGVIYLPLLASLILTRLPKHRL